MKISLVGIGEVNIMKNLRLLESIYKDVTYNDPASIEEINTLEKKLNCKLNNGLKELLLMSNGIEGTFGIPIVYDTDTIIKANSIFRNENYYINTYKPFYDILFFLDAGNGDYFGIRVINGVCQDSIILWNHENDVREVVSENLDKFLVDWGTGKLSI